MINRETGSGSAVLELAVSAFIIAAISLGVYHIQHPQMTQQERISAALQQQ